MSWQLVGDSPGEQEYRWVVDRRGCWQMDWWMLLRRVVQLVRLTGGEKALTWAASGRRSEGICNAGFDRRHAG